MSFGTPEIRTEVYIRSKGICHLCDLPLTRFEMTVDHKIPRIHGGTDDIDNLAAAHESCNIRRGNRPVEDYKKSLKMRKKRLGVVSRTVA